MDHPNPTSNLMGLRLSRVVGSDGGPRNTTVTRFGIAKAKHFDEGHVHVQKLPPLPPLPENHHELEIEHHEYQIAAQRDRSPPKVSFDMLYHQSLAQGFYNLDDKGRILNILQLAL
jgi:hypothetical protein